MARALDDPFWWTIGGRARAGGVRGRHSGKEAVRLVQSKMIASGKSASACSLVSGESLVRQRQLDGYIPRSLFAIQKLKGRGFAYHLCIMLGVECKIPRWP